MCSKEKKNTISTYNKCSCIFVVVVAFDWAIHRYCINTLRICYLLFVWSFQSSLWFTVFTKYDQSEFPNYLVLPIFLIKCIIFICIHLLKNHLPLFLVTAGRCNIVESMITVSTCIRHSLMSLLIFLCFGGPVLLSLILPYSDDLMGLLQVLL
jgi:hypothetical protein